MVINETLARGLKDRFFEEFSTEISAAYRREIASTNLRAVKRGKWVKATRECLERLEPFSIASYEGGSKVKPYFVTNVLEVEHARQYNSWDEKCLYSYQLLFAFDPPFVDCFYGQFNIGEHAIMRLFMRSPVQEDARGNVMPYSIIKQLRFVPFWSTFWIWFRATADNVALKDELSVVIPAPAGLFMAEFSKTEASLEIRTFINYDLTSEDRKRVRDVMVEVSEPLLHSPLSTSPQAADVDASVIFLTMAVCKKLLPHSEILARCLMSGSEQKPASPNSRRLFVEHVSRMAADADAFWPDFESMPLRQFLTHANHMLRLHIQEYGSGAGKLKSP